MPNEEVLPEVLVVSKMADLAKRELWAPMQAQRFDTAQEVLTAVAKLGKSSTYRPDLLIAEISALESFYAGIHGLRQFLCALTRIVRPAGMLVIGEANDENRREINWSAFSREFGIHIRPWGASIGRLQTLHDLPQGFLGLVLDAPKFEAQYGDPKSDRDASLALFVSTDAEAGCHRWHEDASRLRELAWAFSKIDTSGDDEERFHDRYGKRWLRRASKLWPVS